jgi:ribosomal protein L16 Arg81 hydroxylase
MDLKKKTVTVWLLLVQGVNHWWGAVNVVMNSYVPHEARKKLRILNNYQLMNKTLLSAVGKELSICLVISSARSVF